MTPKTRLIIIHRDTGDVNVPMTCKDSGLRDGDGEPIGIWQIGKAFDDNDQPVELTHEECLDCYRLIKEIKGS